MKKVSSGHYEGQRTDGRTFSVVKCDENIGWNLTATATNFGTDDYIYSYSTKTQAADAGMTADIAWWVEV